MKKVVILTASLLSLVTAIGCRKQVEEFVIYTSMEIERLEPLKAAIADSVYNGKVIIESMSTGDVVTQITLNPFHEADMILSLPFPRYSEVADKLMDTPEEVELTSDKYIDIIKDVMELDEVGKKIVPVSMYHSSLIYNKEIFTNPTDIDSYEKIIANSNAIVSMPDPNYSGTGLLIINGWEAYYSKPENQHTYKSAEEFMRAMDGKISIQGYTKSGSQPVKFLKTGDRGVNIAFGIHFLGVLESEVPGSKIGTIIPSGGAPWTFEFNGLVNKMDRKLGVEEFYNWISKKMMETDASVVPTPILAEEPASGWTEKQKAFKEIEKLPNSLKGFEKEGRINELLTLFDKISRPSYL